MRILLAEDERSLARAIVKIFEKNGFTDIEVIKDLAGLDRVVLGRKI